MATKYQLKLSYFERRPDIVKIFDDLDVFKDFCKFEMAPFDESHLYNRESWVWRKYEKARKGSSHIQRPQRNRR